MVRADQLVAFSLEGQDDPKLHLMHLETTGGRFLFGAFDDFDGVWPTVDGLVAMLARRDQRNESGVITTSSSGKVVFVEYDKWADYRGEGEPRVSPPLAHKPCWRVRFAC